MNSLHHELFLMRHGLDRVRVTPDAEVAIRIEVEPLRKPFQERFAAACARAINEIVCAHFGKDVTPQALAGRGNIVQHDHGRGDWHITIDGKLLGVIIYPVHFGLETLRYDVIRDGERERRLINF